MRMVLEAMKKINNMIRKVLNEIDEDQVDEFLMKIGRSRSIFLVGAGRSGLVARAFAMRLMHLGFNVYVVGETITPSAKKGDLMIAISGSGKTVSTLAVVKTAKKLGVTVVTITSFPESPIAKLSDVVVVIKGRKRGKKRDYIPGQLTGTHEPLTPLGSLFELSTMIFLDAVITKLMKIFREEEEDLEERHANLE
jgi:6-phospho-3-hexuloisomerase